jgi:hydroxyethylthiazole kinase-like uncharacterized protein yjeF
MQPTNNNPDLWLKQLPRLAREGHKYDRGHALIFAGGLESVGAARLAARAALRCGAGLVTLGVPHAALLAHAGRSPDALIVQSVDELEGWQAALDDKRRNAVLIGPAFGVGQTTRDAVTCILKAQRSTVLDADALTSFEGTLSALSTMIAISERSVVLTPHEGEFARLFVDIPPYLSRLERATIAAKQVSGIVVLKGPQTIIAAPNGRVVINTNAPADLATAGSGDVLAGLIIGLLAQGMLGFEAACAAVWLHGEAGRTAGAGLIADDLPEAVRGPLAGLRAVS